MKRDLKIFIIILAIIGTAYLTLTYFARSFQFGEFSKEQLLNLQEEARYVNSGVRNETETDYQKYVSPDGRLEVTYLSDWLKTKEQSFLDEIISKDLAKEYDLKVLLLEQKIKEGNFCQLIVSQGIFNNQETFEEIFDVLVENDSRKGWETELIGAVEISENIFIFEAIKTKEGRETIYAKEKVILSGGKAYIITLVTPEAQLDYFREEIEEIINSAKLVD